MHTTWTALMLALLVAAGAANAVAKGPAPLDKSSVFELDDPLEPLVPKRHRSEAEEDRLHAAALFATGRILQRKDDTAGALVKYERAYRYDSDAGTLLDEIVPLAFSLGRVEEAVRYALLAAESAPADPDLLRRLALYLTEQGEWQRALGLYETLLKLTADGQNSAQSVLLHMEMGRLYFLTENYAKAAEAFAIVQAALAEPDRFGLKPELHKTLLGDAGLTYQLLGECYLAAGRLDDAAAVFAKTHEAKPDGGLLGYNLARVEAKKKNPAAALEELQRYFDAKASSQGTSPYRLLDELLGELDQKEKLLERLEALRTADADNASLGYFLAREYFNRGELAKAEAILEPLAAKTEGPFPVEIHRTLIEVYHKTNQPQKLLHTLANAAQRTGRIDLVQNEAQAAANDGPLVAKLIEIARRKRTDQGDGLEPGEALAVAQLAMLGKQFDAAGEFYELAIARQPKRAAELTMTWGLALFLAEQYPASVAVFQRAVKDERMKDDLAAFYYYLAGGLEMSGQTDEAVAAARRAAELMPESAQFASRAAWIQYHAKRHEQAIAAYRAVIEKFDGDHESSDVRDAVREARLVISHLHVLAGQMPQAEEWLEQVLDEFPEDVGALNDLGFLWADQNKRLERSLRMIKRAVAEEPNNKAYLDSLGWVYFRLGRYEEAVEKLREAAAGEDPDGVILDHLGDAYQKLGRTSEAKETWHRAIKAHESDNQTAEAAKVRKKIEQ